MKNMTISRAAALCEGRVCGALDEDKELRHVVIDSRAVQPGDLFVAYRGENADGHDYIGAAFSRGAACCLCERVPAGETRPLILVPSVQTALEAIAAAYRASLSLPVVGITGSVGKTSAKEMIAAVLQQRFSVLKTDGNLNNQIGVPMTLSRIEEGHEAAVVEMGISGFGEMTELAKMVRPTIGVFTVIGHAHLEFLHDLEGVFRAKTEMLSEMDANAAVVVNGDDPWLQRLNCAQKKYTVGLGESCGLRAVELRLDEQGFTRCRLVGCGRSIPVIIPAFGKHMVYAALEGAAVGILLGLSDGEIACGVASYETVGRRSAVTETGFVTLVDDCYNANPDSTRCAIDSLSRLPGRHICILGDMLELGENAAQMHFETGRYAREQGMDAVYTCGELGREIAAGAGESGRHFESRDALIAALPTLLRRGDRVLVKASRGMRFELIAEAVKSLGEKT